MIVGLISLIPQVHAEIERGINYDKEIISDQNGLQKTKQTFLSYERIYHDNQYKDYVFSDGGNFLEIKTATNTIHLDKSTCGFSFYNKNNTLLFNDSIIAFNSIVDQYTWNAVTQVNSAVCEAYYDVGNNALVAKRYAAGVGIMEYKYIFDNGRWKTQLETTNLTGLTNRVFAFDQTINLNRDTINFGGTERNLDSFNGQTFQRLFLENNQANLLDLLNGFHFNLDLGFDYLDSITVTDTGTNKSKLTFHYMRNNEVLLPNETLVIDPTFGPSTGTNKIAFTVLQTTTCGAADGTTTSGVSVDAIASGSSGRCHRASAEFDTSGTDFTGTTITSVTLNADFSSESGTMDNCDVYSIETQPSGASAATLYADIRDGTVLLSNDDFCNANGTNVDIPINAVSDFQSAMASHPTWYAVGISLTNWEKTAATRGITITDYQLTVEYTTLSFQVNDLIVENIGDAFSLTGNFTINAGNLVNVTSIVYSVNGTTITTNSTGQNTTSYPTTINFGPFYYQQLSDSAHNHTVTVNVQDETGNTSNNTSTLETREYEPDYFTATDPTQGLVNYTFVGTNTINVNRDTGGSVFNIECEYFTQAQAFLNEDGTWDNYTNVIFYEGDTSGFYYLRCFNDGELFTTAISQNYSNALVPGLLIFDQLGGFFGAPSIILVILAILSLGTGRNYPIILLIAVSVTGILLALQLLTLDPGLVVVLIVMAGFGLFGIRKFY